jgi:hypothetical protein
MYFEKPSYHQFNANSFGRRFLFAADASGARWSSSYNQT